jgi:hypothetical protein
LADAADTHARRINDPPYAATRIIVCAFGGAGFNPYTSARQR